jgi:hypothetical protein
MAATTTSTTSSLRCYFIPSQQVHVNTVCRHVVPHQDGEICGVKAVHVGVLCPPTVNLYRIACQASDGCTNGGTRDLYCFGPPESNTLRPVRAAVLFALICSRGYKWAREELGPKSLQCESHRWLEVEEERKRELLPRGDGEGKKYKSKPPFWREPLLSLLSLQENHRLVTQKRLFLVINHY